MTGSARAGSLTNVGEGAWIDFIRFSMDTKKMRLRTGSAFQASASFFGSDDVRTLCMSTGAHELHCVPARGTGAHTPPRIHVIFQHGGESRIHQHGRAMTLQAGDWAINASTHPYVVENSDGVEQMMIQFSPRLVQGVMGPLRALSHKRLNSQAGIARILVRYLQETHANGKDISTATAQELAAILVRLFRTTVVELTERYVAKTSGEDLLRRMLTQIDVCIGDPALSAETLGEDLGYSPRHLHHVFHQRGPGGTISSYILARRLDAARRDICDPAQAGASIAQIAFRWGFADQSHFSRRFKDRFSLTPTEAKRRLT